jgi:hypothetical protein
MLTIHLEASINLPLHTAKLLIMEEEGQLWSSRLRNTILEIMNMVSKAIVVIFLIKAVNRSMTVIVHNNKMDTE